MPIEKLSNIPSGLHKRGSVKTAGVAAYVKFEGSFTGPENDTTSGRYFSDNLTGVFGGDHCDIDLDWVDVDVLDDGTIKGNFTGTMDFPYGADEWHLNDNDYILDVAYDMLQGEVDMQSGAGISLDVHFTPEGINVLNELRRLAEEENEEEDGY